MDAHAAEAAEPASVDADDGEVVPGHAEFGPCQPEQLGGDAKLEQAEPVVRDGGDKAGVSAQGANKAAVRLAKLGYPVKEMIGGVTGWRDEGFPLEASPQRVTA